LLTAYRICYAYFESTNTFATISKYNIAAIEKHLKETKGPFPVVVNIVLYHGKTPWNYSTAFADYYANASLGKEFLYMAPFTLVNIPALAPPTIYSDGNLGFCFEAFRCTSKPDPYEAFAISMREPIFKEHFNALPQSLRNLVLAYLGKCIDLEKHSLEDLITLTTSNEKEKEDIMVTIADAIGKEYMQQGMQQGMQQEKVSIAKNLLFNLHLDTQAVAQATGLSHEALMKLQVEAKQ
jgi:Putative transposase, YhgA-like